MAESKKLPSPDPDDLRMSLGDHLEALRGCVIRSLLALLLVCIACIWPAKYLLEIIARPMVLASRAHGQPDSFLATSPVESILVYIKVVIISGIIIAGPYIIWELWHFVAAGLYSHEKRWVYRLVPASVGLFMAGVIFMYTFVLIVSLNFLVGFGGWLPLPQGKPTALDRLLLGEREVQVPATQPALEEAPRIVLLDEDPAAPPVGAVWVNLSDRKLKVAVPNNETYSIQLLRDDARALVTNHFKIGEYLSFVLVLTIAFGVAFQMPLVVVFLVGAQIVSVQTLRSYRKIVIFIIVVIAGILAPPDLMSHLLLSGPMVVLFELGLLLAARTERKRQRDAAEEQTTAEGD